MHLNLTPCPLPPASPPPPRAAPSAEMQALLRSRRERERALRDVHKSQRMDLVTACNELELDALEASAFDLTELTWREYQ